MVTIPALTIKYVVFFVTEGKQLRARFHKHLINNVGTRGLISVGSSACFASVPLVGGKNKQTLVYKIIPFPGKGTTYHSYSLKIDKH